MPIAADIAVVSLSLLMEPANRKDLEEFLRGFECSKNEDVQSFLRTKAIDFQSLNLARTYLVTTVQSIESEDQPLFEILAYFSIALKHISLENVSNSQRKKLNAFHTTDANLAGYLIGQIGTNDTHSVKVTGTELIDMALTYIRNAHDAVGGRLVILECEDDEADRAVREVRVQAPPEESRQRSGTDGQVPRVPSVAHLIIT